MTSTVPGKGNPAHRSAISGTPTENSSHGGMLQVLAVVIGGAALLKVCVLDRSTENLPLLLLGLPLATFLFGVGDRMMNRNS